MNLSAELAGGIWNRCTREAADTWMQLLKLCSARTYRDRTPISADSPWIVRPEPEFVHLHADRIEHFRG